MKKLLILLFSLLFLSSPSVFADDILDFQIEGMSIGDSLLDYMTEDEILKEIERTKYRYDELKEPYKYADVYLHKDFLTYDGVTFVIKNNLTNQYVTDKNEKYTILSIRGQTYYIEDLDGCIQERDEIVEILSKMFPNAQKREWENDSLSYGIFYGVTLEFDSGDKVKVVCTNFEESYRIKHNAGEGLSVGLSTKEIVEWLNDLK